MDDLVGGLLKRSNVSLPTRGYWLPAILEASTYLGVKRERPRQVVPLGAATDFDTAWALAKTRGKLGDPYVLDSEGGVNNPEAYKPAAKPPAKK